MPLETVFVDSNCVPLEVVLTVVGLAGAVVALEAIDSFDLVLFVELLGLLVAAPPISNT